jgi:hypothetical protein
MFWSCIKAKSFCLVINSSKRRVEYIIIHYIYYNVINGVNGVNKCLKVFLQVVKSL